DVLHRLLAEIVVDAVDLVLVENREQLAIERLGGGEVTTERLLDDDAGPRSVARGLDQAGLAERRPDRAERLGRRRQVEDDVALGTVPRGDLVQGAAQLVDVTPAVERAASIVRGALQALEERPVDGRRAELVHRLRQTLAHGLVGERLRAEGDDREVLVEEPVPGEVVERREKLAVREVAAAAEDHQLAGWGGAGAGVVAGGSGHRVAPYPVVLRKGIPVGDPGSGCALGLYFIERRRERPS